MLKVLYDAPPLDWKPIFEQYRDYGRRHAAVRRRRRPHADRMRPRPASASCSKARTPCCSMSITARIPYVTSSNCSALGLYTGAGVPPQTVQNFVGIMKAYTTRVGGGPFPTEQDNNIGEYIRERGNEYGTTTRRPRRCGWFDAMAVRYSVDLCGITAIALTLLDVLSGLDHIQICTGYRYRGQRLDYFRADMDMLAEVEPIYETLPGWNGEHLRLPPLRRTPARGADST